jgi:hypothetical protein
LLCNDAVFTTGELLFCDQPPTEQDAETDETYENHHTKKQQVLALLLLPGGVSFRCWLADSENLVNFYTFILCINTDPLFELPKAKIRQDHACVWNTRGEANLLAACCCCTYPKKAKTSNITLLTRSQTTSAFRLNFIQFFPGKTQISIFIYFGEEAADLNTRSIS